MIVFEGLFIFCLAFLLYTWAGYYAILLLLVKLLPLYDFKINDENAKPFVSILISAFNEEDVIEERILNLLEIDYPKNRMEIMIGSDGSTDKTTEVVKKYADQGVMVVDFEQNRGRADVHNDLIKIAKGSILVFTDADSRFDKLFLKNIVRPFSNPVVGAVVGRLTYRIKGGVIAENEVNYWQYEVKIKDLENKLGILNNGTGACMAIRKELFKPLTPVDDIDTATVIDIIFQGFKVVYMPDALAYDVPLHHAKGEFKMRIRGTSKTLSSIKRRTNFWGWCRRPVLTWSILSHRVFRYITPYCMVVTFFLNAILAGNSIYYKILFILQLLFYTAGLFGMIANLFKIKIPLVSSVFSFLTAMFGMMVGVAMAISGKVKVTYKTEDVF